MQSLIAVLPLLFLRRAVCQKTDVCSEAYRLQCYTNSPNFSNCCDEKKCTGGSSFLACKWKFNMPCSSDSLIEGDVSIGGGAEGEICKKACEILGDKSNKYADYCSGGPLEAKIRLCPSAQSSLELARTLHNTDAWCHGEREYECSWNFSTFLKSQNEFVPIRGSFKYNDRSDPEGSCQKACWMLGNMSNAAEDYCSALKQPLSGCSPALTSLTESAPTWCGSDSLISVHAQSEGTDHRPPPNGAHYRLIPRAVISLSSPQIADIAWSTCNRAWDHQCYNRKPFSDCCSSSCQDGGATHTCAWQISYEQVSLNDTYHAAGCTLACQEIQQRFHDSPFDVCSLNSASAVFANCVEARHRWQTPRWCPSSDLTAVGGAPSSGVGLFLAAAGASLMFWVVKSHNWLPMRADHYQRAPEQPRGEGGLV